MRFEEPVTQVGGARMRRRAFTLIELLTVVAIITLLIGILVPALQRARGQAKATAARGGLNAIGSGLEMFRNENPADSPGDGFPRSTAAEDETEPGQQNISGAQWLVRFMVGKDFGGYVSKKGVPRDAYGSQVGYRQEGWYKDAVNNPPNPRTLGRSPRYVEPDRIKVVRPKHVAIPGIPGDVDESLPNAPATPDQLGPLTDARSLDQHVFVDVFGLPILYYAANVRLAADTRAAMSTPGFSAGGGAIKPGIYSLADNGIFTGACDDGTCVYQGWDFVDRPRALPTDPVHDIMKHGSHGSPDPDRPNPASMRDPANRHTFPYFIMNKNTFDSTSGQSLAPFRKSSFLLISAGQDGVYGTADDITNFE